jgi:Family of unknown function (DUF6352)
MPHFWGSSGHLMLDRDAGGGLVVTDDYLKAYLARPELMPPDDACADERALHAQLLNAPRSLVTPADIARIADADARENWTFMVGWRDRLLATPTLEAAYVRLISEGAKGVPPLFLDQLAHVIARNALDTCEDPYVVRAAECLYRDQRATVHEGTILLADAEIIEHHEHDRHASPLLAMLGGPAVSSLDILKPGNADDYWGRSDAFDMVLDLGGEPSGRKAFAAMLALWVKQLHGFEVQIEPIEKIEDADWRWFVGLDAQATQIGNALWRGGQLSPEMAANVLGLFRMTLPADVPVLPAAQDRPIYLIMAMTDERIVKLKPQNLVTGLPLAETH